MTVVSRSICQVPDAPATKVTRRGGGIHASMARKGLGQSKSEPFVRLDPLDRSVAAFPSMLKASMANDLDAGNRLKLDWLAGKVVALGRTYGIPTPAQEAVYAILKPYRMGRVR